MTNHPHRNVLPLAGEEGKGPQAQREQLRASVLSAEAQGEQNGFLTLDEVMRNADALIREITDTGFRKQV